MASTSTLDHIAKRHDLTVARVALEGLSLRDAVKNYIYHLSILECLRDYRIIRDYWVCEPGMVDKRSITTLLEMLRERSSFVDASTDSILVVIIGGIDHTTTDIANRVVHKASVDKNFEDDLVEIFNDIGVIVSRDGD